MVRLLLVVPLDLDLLVGLLNPENLVHLGVLHLPKDLGHPELHQHLLRPEDLWGLGLQWHPVTQQDLVHQ